ncbi:unnamed protein product [Penicillium pancosmium]
MLLGWSSPVTALFKTSPFKPAPFKGFRNFWDEENSGQSFCERQSLNDMYRYGGWTALLEPILQNASAE